MEHNEEEAADNGEPLADRLRARSHTAWEHATGSRHALLHKRFYK